MKKRMMTIALAALTAVGAGAQSAYDAANITSTELNGTARFVGMGGAMGALGGDISTIGTNPAGLGIFRSNDISLTMGYSSLGTESKLGGQTFSADKNRFSVDNAGFVISTKIGNQTALRYVNFGFNYKKAKSFNRITKVGGKLSFSQTDLMTSQANEMFNYNGVDLWQLQQDKLNPYDDNRVGWLGALAFDTGLVLTDDDPDNPFYNFATEPLMNYHTVERGGIDQYDVNLSFNIQDRVYLGFTLGFSDVNYRKSYFYSEDLGDDNDYSLSSENRIDGLGWNAKFGVIFRPIEESPLRIGLAVHTPTLYSLAYKTSALMQSNLWLPSDTPGEEYLEHFKVDTYWELNDHDMKREFDLRTPWKFNASLGYTVGRNLALGAEYEYEDYSSIAFYEPDEYAEKMDFETQQVKQTCKAVHTFRLGGEYKVIPEFAIRAGYNYSSAAYKDDAVKVLPINSINTDTDFANFKSLSNYTFGIGYRGSRFYADLAYKYTTQKADFYPFAFSDDRPEVTKLTHTRSQAMLTLGMRF